MGGPEPTPFEVSRSGILLRGRSEGEGPDVVLCHGLSANREYVVHGSRHLPRSAYRLHIYDARGHGASDPSPGEEGYGYPVQIADLDAVIGEVTEGGPLVVGGHSMGCHTAAGWALENPGRVRALILIGPVFGMTSAPVSEDRWEERATALERGGPDAFAEQVAGEFAGDRDDRELVARIARRRIGEHRNTSAVVEALRDVPRSRPFESIEQLRDLHVPALVVGSRDELDPGHPLAVAEAWAELIPGAELIVEDEGESPLAWQGGRLSRDIVSFLDRVSREER